MLNRILIISLIIAIAMAVFFKLQSNSREKQLTNAENRIIALETAVSERDIIISEQKRIIEVYAQAKEEANEFEKELNKDNTDNLDVVPADYILKQLHAD